MDGTNGSRQEQDVLADEVNNSLGVSDGESQDSEASHETSEGSHSNETLSVQKRLKSQKRSHEREVRDLHQRIGDLESRMTQPNYEAQNQSRNPYEEPQGGSVEETIHKAVGYALQQKDLEERKAREAQSQAHVQKSYNDFTRHLENMNDKYDDFGDVVFGQDTPYTPHMRDYALTLPRKGAGSAGEVLYKLGKNPDELSRIAKLHPLDQATELAKLSHALIGNGEEKGNQSTRPLGQIKSNPVSNSAAVTEKTPISSLRQRMKSGNWK